MTIIIKNNHKYNKNWKGFIYGKASTPDQITVGTSQGNISCGQRYARILLPSFFTARFHPSTNFYNSCSATVLQGRLSGNSGYSARLIRHEKCSVPVKTSTLYNPPEGPAEAFKKNIFQGILAKIFNRARAIGLIGKSDKIASIDSTGLENHFVGRHFIMRQGGRTKKYRNWTKLLIVCSNGSHLIASALTGKGPSTDSHLLEPAVSDALENMKIETLLADSGFDSEENHRFCHNKAAIKTPVIDVNERNLKYGKIGGFYRRLMCRNFPRKKFRQRWQVESVFSRFKRRLGYALRARTDDSRSVECLLRVLTYNLMVVLLTFKRAIFKVFYKA
jgi:hypothetical protein